MFYEYGPWAGIGCKQKTVVQMSNVIRLWLLRSYVTVFLAEPFCWAESYVAFNQLKQQRSLDMLLFQAENKSLATRKILILSVFFKDKYFLAVKIWIRIFYFSFNWFRIFYFIYTSFILYIYL